MINQYILDLDLCGFSPILAEVGDIANKLLAAQGKRVVSINWPARFVSRSDELKMAFNRARDHQRIK